ncbi:MAG: hypothetical protein ABFS12_15360 [Bacteroidota bacterium]
MNFVSKLFLITIVFTQLLIAQQNYQDVVYLKNGSIIKGMIIEQVPGSSLKIQTKDESVFVYKMDEVEKMTKEEVSAPVPVQNSIHFGNVANSPHDVSLFIKPLGFVLFGPSIAAEFKVAPSSSIGASIRLTGLGNLSQEISDYSSFDEGSMAIGFTTKYLFPRYDSRHGFFVGSLIEYGWGSGTDTYSYDYYDYDMGRMWTSTTVYEYEHSYLSLISNFGFRWVFSSFLMEIGLNFGAAYEIEDIQTSPESIEYENDIYLIYALDIAIGLGF